jgi:hypothetical protein
MRAFKIPLRTFVLLLTLVVCEFGCGRTNSGLPDIFKTDALVRAAAKPQGAAIKGKIDSMTAHEETENGWYGHFDIQLSSGTSGQLLTSYQVEVTKALQSNRVSITAYEPPPGGLNAEEGVFRYLYAWSGGTGLVRVLWGADITNHCEMVVVFSESRK